MVNVQGRPSLLRS